MRNCSSSVPDRLNISLYRVLTSLNCPEVSIWAMPTSAWPNNARRLRSRRRSLACSKFRCKVSALKSGRLRPGETLLVPSRAVVTAALDIPDPAIEIYGSRARSGSRTERPVLARTVMVNRERGHLLARSALAGDNHGCVGGRDLANGFEHRQHRRAGSELPFERITMESQL